MGQEEEHPAAVQAAVGVSLSCGAELDVADHPAVAGITRLVLAARGLVEGLTDVVKPFGGFEPHHVLFVGEVAVRQ